MDSETLAKQKDELIAQVEKINETLRVVKERQQSLIRRQQAIKLLLEIGDGLIQELEHRRSESLKTL